MTQNSYTPTARLFILLSILLIEGIACLVWDWAVLLWMLSFIVAIIACIGDWISLQKSQFKQLKHMCHPHPTMKQPFTLRVWIEAESQYPIHVESVQSDQLKLDSVQGKLEPDTSGTVIAQWNITPTERGLLAWDGCIISLKSPLGLLCRWQTLESIQIKVYPKLNKNLQSMTPKMLLQVLGMKQQRFRRADQVFESLRPYVSCDPLRHVDWKATARSNALITRQYDLEQHHNILICLDSSRLMGTLTEDASKLDCAIEAALHLAHLANSMNDRISLMVFSQSVEQWIKPQRNPVDAFLHGLYDVRCKIVEADFNQLCTQILTIQKKRSLVIFLSDFIDSSALQPFMPAFSNLNRKHCSLFIGIEDPAYQKYLYPVTNEQKQTAQDLTRRLVAQDSMARRQQALSELRRLGLHAISAPTETLAMSAMASYLQIKHDGAI